MLPPRPGRAAAVALAFVALLYVLELTDQLFFQMGPTTPGSVHGLDVNGIQPREVEGLDGIIWAPLLHYGWEHLMANTLPLLVLGWLCMAGGIRRFVAVTAVVWLVGGLGTWLVAGESTTHLGASGIAFGWLMFLLVRGFFTGSVAQILVAVVLVVYWGGMLWGVLPGQQGVSWQAHLFGAVGGVLAAWLVTRSDRPHRAGSARSGDLPGRLGS
ncbi:rhomboid family intramembrane serine protease [Actinopolyspora biskrensis]|uniref:rhomboid family intramembrane serine protease n=1 Tax=Actinopolyspora biskrensis TaxID=1470178 RepID=UPI0015C82E0D